MGRCPVLPMFPSLALTAFLLCCSGIGGPAPAGAHCPSFSPHGHPTSLWRSELPQAPQASRRKLRMRGMKGGRRRRSEAEWEELKLRKGEGRGQRGRGVQTGAGGAQEGGALGREVLLEVVASARAFSVQGVAASLPHKVDLRNLRTMRLLPGVPEKDRESAASGKGSAAARFGRRKLRFLRECGAAACPEFKACDGSRRGIDMCWNGHLAPQEAANVSLSCPEPLEARQSFTLLPSHCGGGAFLRHAPRDEEELLSAWAGQVAVLHNVFVGPRGDVFNGSHRFLAGGCDVRQGTQDTILAAGTTAVAFDKLVNMAVPNPWEPSAGGPGGGGGPRGGLEYEEVAVKLPLFLSLATLMPRLKHWPWALQNTKAALPLWRPVIGYNLVARPLAAVTAAGPLLYARELIQPLLPPCHHPSFTQWQAFRGLHLVAPATLPITPALPRPAHRAKPGLAPKGPPPMGPHWVVVVSYVGVPPAFQGLMQGVEEALGRLFRRTRVVAYHGRMPFRKTKELFNAAVLLVGPTGDGLLNMALMPFNASVLEIKLPLPHTNQPSPMQQGTQEGSQAHVGSRYESLARACGLVHYSLDCTDRTASGEHTGACPPEAVLGALESVQHGLFRSPWFSGSLLTGDPRGYNVGLPGTKVVSLRQRHSLDRWLRCVAEEGTWLLDPIPRVLPWPYKGVPGECHAVRSNETGAMGMLESDAHARAKGSAALWRVPRVLKYVWDVPTKSCGKWFPIDTKRLCKAKGGKPLRIVTVGDSLNGRFAQSLVNTLVRRVPKPADWAVAESVPQSCRKWGEQERHGDKAPTVFCITYTLHESLCANLSVTFVRSDHLQISGNPGGFDRQPWTHMREIEEADLVLLNGGAGRRSREHHLSRVRSALRHLRERFPEKLLVYRSTPPEHASCWSFKEPLAEPQNSQRTGEPHEFPLKWHTFADHNNEARATAEDVGAIFLDVEPMSRLRADNHPGKQGTSTEEVDCLHWCIPGPLDTWAQLLYNVIFQAMSFS